MPKTLEVKCRICRREGTKLFLKGDRCETAKCSLDKNPKIPGQHGAKRRRVTDYGLHLREKQKLKQLYGLSERQFKRYFAEALRQPGNTGENLLILMERKLDNIVYATQWSTSRIQARQLIAHGHITVNNRRCNIPSAWVKAGDIINPTQKEASVNLIKKNLESAKKVQIPSWVKLSEEPLQIQIVQLPKRPDIAVPINEQLVVEFSSR